MTRQALLGKLRHVPLWLMNVVARRTRHLRTGAEALAALQEPHLIPMHVGDRSLPGRWRNHIIIELRTGPVGERRPLGIPFARMAQRANVQLPISGETRRIENVFPHRLRRMRRVILDVLLPRAMALLTGNTERVVARVSQRTTIPIQRERSGMTLQTARDDESSKVHLTIVIPGTVYPRSDSAQIRDRQLEQEPGLPEEIGLSSSPRPDHDVDTLGR